MHTTSVRWLIAILLGIAGVAPVARAATLPDATTAKAAIKCQRAIVQSGTKFVTGKLNSLQGCTGAILTCIQVKNASTQCLKAANKKCTNNLARILTAEAVFARTVTAACVDVSTADLAADIGLHYQLDEERCLADFAADVSTREGVVTCIVREHARTAERLFALQQARTVRLLEFAGVARNTLCDVPANPDCDGCAVTNPPGSGKAIATCAATVAKAGTAFAAKLIASLAKCTKSTFACAATPATAEKMNACRLKAGDTCIAAFSTLAAMRDAVDAKIANNKSCGAIPFGVLADKAGLNLDALAPGCSTAVSGSFPSLTAYAQCLQQQHECRVDELAPFAVPRISELLGTVGLDSPFVCAELAPLTAARIGAPLLAATAETDGDLGAIIATINSPGGIAQGTLTPGGFKPSTPGASNTVTGAAGTTTYRVAQPKPIKVAYTRCGDPKLTPKLIVSAKNENGSLLPGFFELPLAKPAGDADAAEVDVTFQPTVRSCVRLAFATECGDDVSPYVRFEQVPEIDPKETATPTPTATAPAPTRTLTPTASVPTPTQTPTPTASGPVSTRTATPTITSVTQTPTPVATSTIDCDTPLVMGTIANPIQTDRFDLAFSVAAAERLEINLSAVAPVRANFDPVWRLLDANGVDKCGGNFHAGLADCAPDGTGNPYRIEVVDGSTNDTGSYILHLQRLNAQHACEHIALSDAAVVDTEAIDSPIDTDLFQLTFTVQPDQTLTVNVVADPPVATNFNPSWMLLDANGIDKCGGFHTAARDCPLDGTGNPYRVEVFDGFSNATGRYRLFVKAPVTTATIDCDTPLATGTIADSIQRDLIEPTFSVAPGERLEINLSALAPVRANFDPVWRLLDANGVDECGGVFHAGLADCAPDGTGNPYRIEVVDGSLDDTGSYILHVQRLNAQHACEHIALSNAVVVDTEAIDSPIDTDLFQLTFAVQPGQTLTVNVLADAPVATNFNPSWMLLDANGIDKCGGFHTGLGDCPLDGTGNPYRVEVFDGFSNATGRYSVFVQK